MKLKKLFRLNRKPSIIENLAIKWWTRKEKEKMFFFSFNNFYTKNHKFLRKSSNICITLRSHLFYASLWKPKNLLSTLSNLISLSSSGVYKHVKLFLLLPNKDFELLLIFRFKFKLELFISDKLEL